ncbi:hypothetical protein pb186bvf_002204 [Paramecium bursaria]
MISGITVLRNLEWIDNKQEREQNILIGITMIIGPLIFLFFPSIQKFYLQVYGNKQVIDESILDRTEFSNNQNKRKNNKQPYQIPAKQKKPKNKQAKRQSQNKLEDIQISEIKIINDITLDNLITNQDNLLTTETITIPQQEIIELNVQKDQEQILQQEESMEPNVENDQQSEQTVNETRQYDLQDFINVIDHIPRVCQQNYEYITFNIRQKRRNILFETSLSNDNIQLYIREVLKLEDKQQSLIDYYMKEIFLQNGCSQDEYIDSINKLQQNQDEFDEFQQHIFYIKGQMETNFTMERSLLFKEVLQIFRFMIQQIKDGNPTIRKINDYLMSDKQYEYLRNPIIKTVLQDLVWKEMNFEQEQILKVLGIQFQVYRRLFREHIINKPVI